MRFLNVTPPMGILHQLQDAFNRESSAQQTDKEVRTASDIFECEECGTTFISKPTRCTQCDQVEFRNLGSF